MQVWEWDREDRDRGAKGRRDEEKRCVMFDALVTYLE
jgi:hypothetical protein